MRESGRYLRPEELERLGMEEGESDVEVSWEKMSKSKYNGVDPEVGYTASWLDHRLVASINNCFKEMSHIIMAMLVNSYKIILSGIQQTRDSHMTWPDKLLHHMTVT